MVACHSQGCLPPCTGPVDVLVLLHCCHVTTQVGGQGHSGALSRERGQHFKAVPRNTGYLLSYVHNSSLTVGVRHCARHSDEKMTGNVVGLFVGPLAAMPAELGLFWLWSHTRQMAQRLTYRRRHAYHTKSNRTRIVKTPGQYPALFPSFADLGCCR